MSEAIEARQIETAFAKPGLPIAQAGTGNAAMGPKLAMAENRVAAGEG